MRVGLGLRAFVRLGEAVRMALPRRRPATPAVVIESMTTGEAPLGVVEDSYPLSPMQQGLLVESLTAGRPGVNLEQVLCRFDEDLDIPALRRAWARVVRQHAILRSGVRWDGSGTYVQDVHQTVRLSWADHDWRHLSPRQRRRELERFLQEDRRKGFDVSAVPLMRLSLIRDGRRRYQCWWTVHHLVVDVRVFLLVLSDVLTCYDGYRRGRDPDLGEPRRYREYVEWLQRADHSRSETFWRQRLQGFRAPTPLVVARTPDGAGAVGEIRGEQEFALSRQTTQALRSLASANGFTLNTVVHGAWALLLGRYSGQDDVLFGAVRACRRSGLEGAEEMVGPCINTVPVRVQIPEGERLVPWLRKLREQWRAIREHEQCPLSLVGGWSEVAPGRPLFESLVNFQEPGWATVSRERAGNRSRDFRNVSAPSQPLALDAYGGSSLLVKVLYDPARFEASTIERMLGHLRTLLEKMAPGGDLPLSALDLLTPGERRRVVVEWNDTATRFPRDRTVHGLYEEQTRRTPDAIAVTFGSERLTYAELHDRTDRLAGLLRARGVRRSSVVGVCAHRSADMIVGFLGVLKAGGAYLPLDPGYPSPRLALMLDDSRVSVLLTQERLRAALPGTPAEVISLDGDWGRIPRGSAHAPASGTADDPAYVMYTSGSTGTPKGVVVPHRAVARLVKSTNYIHLGPGDRVAQASNGAFDAATFEIWGALLNGAELVGMTTDVLLSPGQFASQVKRDQLTTLFLTTALFNAMARESPTAFQGMRTVLFGGEKVDPHWVREVLANGPPERLLHVYGPTETTTFATAFVVASLPSDARTVPIGRPIANTQVYVVDRVGHPVPVGVPGELLIGGDGVALGYLNRPELDAERFLPDRFRGRPSSRLYRTGDLVRYGPEGELEFLGRVDNQVKIRGFRVEPEEIEAVLAQHPAVRAAVVVLREDVRGDRRLVGYVVLDEGADGGSAQLRRFLSGTLPDYMIPSTFVVIPSLPLTLNGKIDRDALPRPADVSPAQLPAAATADRTPVEEIVAAVWAEVLETAPIGSDVTFFEQGGDSLQGMEVMIQLGEAFQLDLPASLLFERPTVTELSLAIGELRSRAARTGPLTAVPRAAPLPLSYFQERVWRYCQTAADPLQFITPTRRHLKGRLDIGAFECAMTEIVRRHEVLRTTFSRPGDHPVQTVGPARPMRIPVMTVPAGRGAWAEVRRLAEAEAGRPFDLERDPPLRATLLRLSDTNHVLLLTMHHLIYAPSLRQILFRELTALYGAYSRGEPSPLPEPRFQYGDFAVWQRRWLHPDGELCRHQLAYWKERLRGPLPVIRLAPRPPGAAADGSERSASAFRVPDSVYRELKALARREGATLFMVLLAACNVVLSHRANLEDVIVGSVVESSSPPDLAGVMGLKGNLLVLRTDLSGDPTFRTLLRRVRRVTLDALDHQGLPFEELAKALARDGGQAPPIEVIFQHTRRARTEWSLPGLKAGRWPHTGKAKRWGLSMVLVETDDRRLTGEAGFDTDRYDWVAITAMMAEYRAVLARVVEDPDRRLSELGGRPTVADLSEAIDELRSQGKGRGGPLRVVPRDRPLPLSYAQERLWGYCQTTPDPRQFVSATTLRLKGPLDVAAFERALTEIVRRHEVLRTTFSVVGGQPVQIVGPARPMPVPVVPLPPGRGAWSEARRLAEAEAGRPFDLERDPMLRVALLRKSDADHMLLLTAHHLVYAPSVLRIFFRELNRLYDAYSRGESSPLPAPAFQYGDYAVWQRRWLHEDSELYQHQLAYWKDRLRGPLPVFRAAPRPAPAGVVRRYPYAARARIPDDVYRELTALGRREGATLYMVLLAAGTIVLGQMAGLEDVVIGSVVEGSNPRELAGVMGLKGNLLGLRTDLSGDPTFRALLRRVRRVALDALDHQDLQFEELVKAVTRDGGNGIPIQVIFQHTQLAGVEWALPGLKAGRWRQAGGGKRWGLSVGLIECPDRTLVVTASFDTALYDWATMAAMVMDYRALLARVAADPDLRVSELRAGSAGDEST